MTETPFISCRELIDFIADYLDGTLPADEKREFERHLHVCPACVAYLDSYRRTVSLGKASLAAPAPDDAPAGLLEAIRAARKKH
jgi:anti-sigma factor RsiW